MTELTVVFMFVVAVAAGLVSNRFGTSILILAVSLVVGGILLWSLFIGLHRLDVWNVTRYTWVFVWLIVVSIGLGISVFMGSVLHFAGMNGWLSWRLVVYSCVFAAILTGLSVLKGDYVNQQAFDPRVHPAASVYIIAYGWPGAFLGDVPDVPNYRWLPGDTIRYTTLFIDWLTWLYITIVLCLAVRRYALVR